MVKRLIKTDDNSTAPLFKLVSTSVLKNADDIINSDDNIFSIYEIKEKNPLQIKINSKKIKNNSHKTVNITKISGNYEIQILLSILIV